MKSMKLPTDITNAMSISRASNMQISTKCEDKKIGLS